MSDLALILVVAGAVTLLFKKLRQPLVLGYIVAGFLVSPHMPYTMSVVDKGDVEMWAEIGVMFLLFSLGLDFSVKKILKMGTSPVIAACTIVFSMILLGITVGKGFGWGHMDCIFLGGMLAMSSTTIIYKALSDMGLLQQGFVATVMSVCILEDILAGQALFGTMGYLLGGQSLKNAMRCGFSMAQVGEFAFIIASLGLSLGVIGDFLYPVVVAVSVITTFLTPYMIRAAEPCYNLLTRHLPRQWSRRLEHIGTGAPATPSSGHLWKRLLRAMVVNTLIYGILSIAVIALMFSFALPFCRELSTELTGSHWAGNAVCGIATVLMIAPFLRAFMMKKNHSEEFKTLWTERRTNRPPLVFTVLVRLAIAAAYIFYIANYLTRFADALLITIAFGTIVLMVLSRSLKKRSIRLERLFVQNLRSREIQAEALGRKRPLYEGRLLDREIHMSLCEVPEDSLWAGKQLAELDFRKHFGVNVSSILRGRQRINIPNGEVALFPGDQLQVIGDDDQLTRFAQAMRTEVHDEDAEIEKREMRLQQIIVGQKSPFLDQTLRESGIRDRYNCMVVGLDEGEKNLTIITPNYRFALGDVLWIVGEEQNVKGLLEANGEE